MTAADTIALRAHSTNEMIRYLRITLVLAAPVCFGFWSLALGQDANWDLRNYHWYNAFALLNWRFASDIAPASIQSYQSSLFDVPWYVLGQLLPARAVGFIIGAVHSLIFLFLYALSLKTLPFKDAVTREIAAICVSVIGVLGAGTAALIGTTFNDLMVTIGALASLVLAMDAISPEQKRAVRAAFIAGLPMGFTVAGKLTAASFAVALTVAFLAISAPWLKRFQLATAFAGGAAVMIAIFLGPWAFYLWHEFGNPLFPFFNEIFHSPLTTLGNEFDPNRRWPSNLRQWILYPIYFGRHPELLGDPIPVADFRMAAAYVTIPICLLVRRFSCRSPASDSIKYLFVSMAVSYVIWVNLFGYYRYAVTLEALSPLAVALALSLLPFQRVARDAGFAIMTFLVLTGHAAGWERIPWQQQFVGAKAGFETISDHSLVVLLDVPLAYLVPLLPSDTTVVQLSPQFAPLNDRSSPWNARMREKINQAWPNRYGIAVGFPNVQDRVKVHLTEFGLTADMSSCRPLVTTMSEIDFPDAKRLTVCKLLASDHPAEWP